MNKRHPDGQRPFGFFHIEATRKYNYPKSTENTSEPDRSSYRQDRRQSSEYPRSVVRIHSKKDQSIFQDKAPRVKKRYQKAKVNRKSTADHKSPNSTRRDTGRVRSVSEMRYERLGEWFNPSLNYIKYVLCIIAYSIFLDHILLGFGRRVDCYLPRDQYEARILF